MARSRLTRHNQPRHPVLHRWLLGALYFGALCLLMMWEARDRLDFLGPACVKTDSPPKSSIYDGVYRLVLRSVSHDASYQVSVVDIPLDFSEVQDICTGRAFMADLLRTIAAEHPAEIVIDKYYSPNGCSKQPAANAELTSAVRSLNTPVVVGESEEIATKDSNEDCLVRKPQLDFGAPNVHHGLIRLNIDTERVPLEWEELPEDGASVKPQTRDSLAWTAVKVYDPTYAAGNHIQKLIDSGQHPYANLEMKLPEQTAATLLCTAGTPEVQKRWSLSCNGPLKSESLLGKIVVIGSESPNDEREILGSRIWGFNLQARYIEALLSGKYLRAVPFPAAFTLFGLFVFVIEGLPTLLIALKPRWKRHPLLARAYTRRRYIWVSFWALFFILATSVISLALRFLPPLAVLTDILLISVTRLLFFAAESTETPFVHAKHKGANHAGNK